jgi:hypothetical protein
MSQRKRKIKYVNGEKMLKKILPILLAFSVLLTACGNATPATPTPDIGGTAAAVAYTMVAMTQTAMPTPTPVPPTDTPLPTPLPTFTSVAVIPTLEQVTLPPPTAIASDPNNCNRTLNIGEAGYLKNVRIENQSPGQVNLSLNLYKPNLFGQCGSLGYVIKKGEKRKIAIPAGYWYAYSWVVSPPSTGSVSFYIGPSKSDDLLRLVIKKDIIAWVGP